MKYFKVFLTILVIMFLGLFFAYQNGLGQNWNKEKKVLTEEMIKEYEEDLKKGIDVTQKEYVIVKPSYANTYSSNILKVSKKIEEGIDRVIKYFFRKVSDSINNEK